VYKAARKREFERLRKFDEEIERETSEKQFLKEREERERQLAEKTAKNRKRREKKKGKKGIEGEDGKVGGEKAERAGLKISAVKRSDEVYEDVEDGDGKEAPEGLLVIEDD